MSKRFLGLLLPFLLVYGIDDLDLDGLDLPQVEQEAKSEEKKPDEVEKVVVPLSEAKEAEEGKGAEEAKEGEKSGSKVEAKAGDKTEESTEAAQKEASQEPASQNPAAQESGSAEGKQDGQPQGEKPEANQAGEQKSQGQGVDEAAKAGAQSGDASAPNVASDMPDLPTDLPTEAKESNPAAESKDKNSTQGADTKASEVALPEELQMQNQEIPAPAPRPKAEDKLPEGFGPEDLPPEALDGVSGGANPAAGSNAQNAAPNATLPAAGAAGAGSNPASPNPALPNQDPNAPAAPQGATPPASTQPKVQLEENAKQSDKKQDGKEVTFTQEDFFELDEDDFMLEKRDGGYVLKVLSLDLEAFVNGKSYNEKNQVQTFGVNENYTQITSHDGKIQEYKFFQKAGKKNTILNRVKVPLKKLDFDSYKLVMKDTPSFFDTTNCKVGIKKELRATLNQNKEVIIDLDIRRELRNTTKFKLFLDCPR